MKSVERHHRLMTLALLAAGGIACSDGPTSPTTGTIEIVIHTLGIDVDGNGYDLVIDGAQGPRLGFIEGSRALRPLPVGMHTVKLSDVAGNCSVQGSNPQSITLTGVQRATVIFTVACEVSGIEVVTHTAGVDVPAWFSVDVNGKANSVVAANGARELRPLEPGSYTITLRTSVANCTFVGSAEVTVHVSLGSLTPVRFDVTCSLLPRAQKIAVVVDTLAEGFSSPWIALMDPDGSAYSLLTRGDTPSWSTDGKRLVVSTLLCDWDWDLDPDIACNGGLKVRDPEGGEEYALESGRLGLHPSWASTGEIAFSRCCDYRAGSRPFAIISRGHSTVTPLTINGPLYLYTPSWSPDGARIAFECVFVANNQDICVVERDGSNLRRLTNGQSLDREPSWSPDGTRIAFTVDGTIAVMRADGGDVIYLTPGYSPVWSPDGTALAFVASDGLYTVHADGTHRTLIKRGHFRSPAWRP